MNTVTTPIPTADTQIMPCTCDSVLTYLVIIGILGVVTIVLILIVVILVLSICRRNCKLPFYNTEKPLQPIGHDNHNEKIEFRAINNYYCEYMDNKYQFK